MKKEDSKSKDYINILTDIVGEQRNMTDEELIIYRKMLYQDAEHYSLSYNKKFLVDENTNNA